MTVTKRQMENYTMGGKYALAHEGSDRSAIQMYTLLHQRPMEQSAREVGTLEVDRRSGYSFNEVPDYRKALPGQYVRGQHNRYDRDTGQMMLFSHHAQPTQHTVHSLYMTKGHEAMMPPRVAVAEHRAR